jgi:cardiolipin synthase
LRLFVSFLLLLSVSCASTREKWHWVHTALLPVEAGSTEHKPIRPVPDFRSHPFFEASFQRQLDKLSSSQLSTGNELRLLADAKSTEKRLEMIERAQSSIYITSFMVICDVGGNAFLDALARASSRGVDVKLLIDGGIWTLYAGSCPEQYVSHGIQVARAPLLHDKIFVIDGKEAVTGGQNIGSFWADSTGTDENYRDTDVWVKGPVVNEIARRFVQLWKNARPKDHGLDKYEGLLDKRARKYLERGLSGIANYESWLKGKQAKGLCRFVGQDPELGTHHVIKTYTALAQAAQKHVALHALSLDGLGSPEQESLRNALVNAAQKNVRIDIITNGPGPSYSRMLNRTFGILTRTAGYVYGVFTLGRVYDSVKDTSLNLYVYKSFLHSKLYDFDSMALAVGSLNFDETAIDWTESTLICMDKSLSSQAADLLYRDFSHSR